MENTAFNTLISILHCLMHYFYCYHTEKKIQRMWK